MWTSCGASYTNPCTCTACVAALACIGRVEGTLAQAKHVAGSTNPFPLPFYIFIISGSKSSLNKFKIRNSLTTFLDPQYTRKLRERTCAQELKSSSVEARKLICSSFQLNEATTPSTSSFQLTSAPFSSTSAPLAQLKLNNPEVAESVLRQLETILREGRVSRDMCHAHGAACDVHMHLPHMWPAITDPSLSFYAHDVSTTMPAKVADPEVLPLGPITRSRARKFREVLSLTCTKLSDSFDDVSALDN
ncbi:hypothetical protein V6N11_056174 [Hibiscus sabdariffa]|uniref:Uncharacterized protein n=1 Tax=Hibiscus sabdariffa TaxID=183260 RepID=A0ABR2T342_9ROSI